MNESTAKSKLWQLFLALAPVLVGTFLTIYYIKDKPKLNYLEYLKNVNNSIIDLPLGLSKDIVILHRNEPIKNLSTVCYRIFNRTDHNYSNVEIYVNFDPDQKGTISYNLVKSNIKGPENYPKYGFKKLPTTESNIVGWVVDSINMSAKASDFFQIDLIFLDAKAPQSKLCVEKTGLDIEPMATIDRKFPNIDILVLIAIGVCIGFLIALILSYTLGIGRKRV